MKKKIFKTLALVFAFVFMLVPFMGVQAETAIEVTDEASLIAALETGGSIILKNDIAVKNPLHAMKDATILGDGFTLSSDPTFERETSGNGSLITVHSGATVTFEDITIVNDATRSKYGIQAYDGGIAVLDGVTIENCKFGAILVNGGGLVVVDLTMSGNAYGIEFGRGTSVTNNPVILMMGTINGNQDTLLWLAENDNLEKVEFANVQGSAMTLSYDENANTLVLKDDEETVVATSNEAKDGLELIEQEIDLDDDTETEPTPEQTPSEPAENNPDTADINVMLIASLAAVGILGTVGATKKVLRRN